MEDKAMYTLPGSLDITEKDVERYTKSNDRLIQVLPELIERDLLGKDANARQAAASIIRYASAEARHTLEEKLVEFIQRNFTDKNSFLREEAVKLLLYTPEETKASLIQQGLNDDDLDVQIIASRMIQCAPEETREVLIQQAIVKDDWRVRWGATKMIQHAPEKARAALIQRAFKDNDWDVRVTAVEMIQYVSEDAQLILREKIPKFIQEGLDDEASYVRAQVLKMIPYAPEKARAALIQSAFKDNDWNVRVTAVEMIQYATEDAQTILREKIPKFIQEGLDDEASYVRAQVLKMIPYAPEEARANFIQRCLTDDDRHVRWKATWMIQHAPEKARATLIQKALEDNDWFVRKTAVEMIQHASEEARADPLKQIGSTEQSQKVENIDFHALATETPLYGESTDRFFKKEFYKTGSGTTLLDRVPPLPEVTLKERVIIRHISANSYFSWKKAFESSGYWKGKGFEYVPIEPIISVKPQKLTTKVDVFARVLQGPSVKIWNENNGPYQTEIEEQISKIKTGLDELGITHGHTHEGNFVLYFQRKQDGTADLSRSPRVYAIDFDAAVSPA